MILQHNKSKENFSRHIHFAHTSFSSREIVIEILLHFILPVHHNKSIISVLQYNLINISLTKMFIKTTNCIIRMYFRILDNFLDIFSLVFNFIHNSFCNYSFPSIFCIFNIYLVQNEIEIAQ